VDTRQWRLFNHSTSSRASRRGLVDRNADSTAVQVDLSFSDEEMRQLERQSLRLELIVPVTAPAHSIKAIVYSRDSGHPRERDDDATIAPGERIAGALVQTAPSR